MQVDYSKARCLFTAAEEGNSDQVTKAIRFFLIMENTYAAAAREIRTRLENLNEELKVTQDRTPIHQITSRVKTPESIVEKLRRKGFEVSMKSAVKNLSDIAGVRVICRYIDDIYLIADLLISQDDIELLRRVDYIKHPKPNGYRSLHLVVTVPVFLSKRTERVKVEIQIRTIAMDYWASLEHDLVYKLTEKKTAKIVKELKDCADVIAETDVRMQKLYNMITQAEGSEKSDEMAEHR